ncbi:MAG: hypothetical protein CSA05_00460 [Bacteroidia bacterium]|nr:MAG: hypothetical protein CSB01_00250 [Bacteroidia bacterium]PIE86423.1 MAG: hypothetical protein CSA05_00460 [Bacteroidia bacterium]
MLQIGETVISLDIIEKCFICDIEKCQGICCVLGDSGAPLEDEEVGILEEIYDDIEPYLTPKGKKAIEEQGVFIIDFDSEFVTPLIENKECAYAYFENGTCKCAIEKAFLAGAISFKKPVSCHLYPIRISKLKKALALNYDQWNICKAAVKKGKAADVKIFQFLEEPLTRKFGKEWYEQLKTAYKHFDQTKE